MRCCRWRAWRASRRGRRAKPAGIAKSAIYDFFPMPKTLLDELLPLTVKTALFQAFLDATTSEHVARMISMKSATDNADKMVKIADDAIQPRPAEPDHDGTVGNHGRRRGDEGVTAFAIGIQFNSNPLIFFHFCGRPVLGLLLGQTEIGSDKTSASFRPERGIPARAAWPRRTRTGGRRSASADRCWKAVAWPDRPGRGGFLPAGCGPGPCGIFVPAIGAERAAPEAIRGRRSIRRHGRG